MCLDSFALCPKCTLEIASSIQILFSPLLSHHHSLAYNQILFKVEVLKVSQHVMQQNYRLPTCDHWTYPVKVEVQYLHFVSYNLCCVLYPNMLSCCQSHEDDIGPCPGNQNEKDKPLVTEKAITFLKLDLGADLSYRSHLSETDSGGFHRKRKGN